MKVSQSLNAQKRRSNLKSGDQPEQVSSEPKETVTIQLLHTTDMHGTASPIKKKVEQNGETVKVDVGGAAALAEAVDEYREQNPRTLLLDSGDSVSGQVVTDMDGGRSMVELMNHIGYDAAIPGNHAFDFGPEALRDRINKAEYPILTSNVSNSDGSEINNTERSHIFDLNGVKVGVLGLLTDKVEELVPEDNRKGFEVSNLENSLDEQLPKIREQGAEMVVVLSHQDDDLDEALAESHPDEGLIILGGHSHVPTDEVKEVAGNYVFKSGSLSTTLGHLLVEFDPEADRIVGIQADLHDIEPKETSHHPELVEMVSHYKDAADEVMGEVVGHMPQTLTRKADCDSDLGNWVTDAMRDYYGADVAMINTDGIRSDLEGGQLTKGDLHAIRPFSGAEAVPGKITGDVLKKALEHSITCAEDDGKSPFLQVSGVTFSYDEEGVHDVKVGGQALDPKKTYNAVINTYLTSGKLGYEMFNEEQFENAGIGFRECLTAYLEKPESAVVEPHGTRIKDQRAKS